MEHMTKYRLVHVKPRVVEFGVLSNHLSKGLFVVKEKEE